jgi:EAL and modified HD-GYP domain-containing signal transduction protein
MSRSTVLDSIALGYQPVWNRARQLAAVRLSVHTVQPEGVDAEHLLQILEEDWPLSAPPLVLAFDHPTLWQQALTCTPVANTWLQVPGACFTTPDGLAHLSVAVRRGHTLLRHAALADVRGEIISPLDVRSLLSLSAEEALQALQARPTEDQPVPLQRSPIVAGQIYEGVGSRSLADHCLDEAGAWGLLEWPDEDVLHSWRHRPVPCDPAVISQVREALDKDAALDRIERYVRQDPVLVHRLLVRVNSAGYGLSREIESLRHALMMIGFGALDTWLAEQLAASEESDSALHPVRYGMVMRARLAQHLLDSGSDDNLRSEVFLTALFGQLDRLLHKPLPELLGKLPLPGRAYDALLRETGPYNAYLEVSRAQGRPAQLAQLPQVCEHHGISLEHANRGLLRMLGTSRDMRRPAATMAA